MIKYNQNLCPECFEPISNPICPSCLEREIESWLDSLTSDSTVSRIIHSELRKLKEKTEDIGQTTNCIICGKNAEVCSFCFIEDIEKALYRNKISQALIKEFTSLFNYKDFGQY